MFLRVRVFLKEMSTSILSSSLKGPSATFTVSLESRSNTMPGRGTVATAALLLASGTTAKPTTLSITVKPLLSSLWKRVNKE